MFESKVVDFGIENNALKSITYKDLKSNELKTIETDSAVFAIGHSARDTFEMLYNLNLNMESNENIEKVQYNVFFIADLHIRS